MHNFQPLLTILVGLMSSTICFGEPLFSSMENRYFEKWINNVEKKPIPYLEKFKGKSNEETVITVSFRNDLVKHTQIKDSILKENIDYFTSTETVSMMADLIIQVEVGPFIPTLNEMPYIGHGLLQPTTEWLRKRNTDTSFGWFGFIYGTLADSIEAANTRSGSNNQTYAERHSEEINDVTRYLSSIGYNVPKNQVVAFYTFYMSKISQVMNGPALYRRLNGMNTKLVKDIGEKENYNSSEMAEFINIATFYKVYNGALDESKIRRLSTAFSSSKNKISQRR